MTSVDSIATTFRVGSSMDLFINTSAPPILANLLNLLTNNISTNCTYDDYDNCLNISDNQSNTTLTSLVDLVADGNRTNSTGDGYDPPKYWAFILVLFPLFTLFGNILVVLSVVKEKQLQTMTNYFIVSLAIADIMVAVLVMPLAVYVEVMNGRWTFENDALCDAWVAFDVTFCTASILNLTAISVDRFMAVTRPISYSRHKNNNRVYITIAITWLISIGIGSPIALGANKTADRQADFCVFYNSDFLIWSSLGSFYIPCIVMIILYWRIFKVIHERARKSIASKNRMALSSSAPSNMETKNSNSKATELTSVTAVNNGNNSLKAPLKNGLAEVVEEGSSTQTDEPDPECVRSPTIESEIWVRRESFKARQNADAQSNATASCDSSPKLNHEDREICKTKNGKKMFSSLRLPLFHKKVQNGHGPPGETVVYADPSKGEQRTTVKFRFQFHLPKRGKKSKKDARSSRERKATKTLAIVLGAFLVCWVPFFTVNVINAFCIRYDLKIGACKLDNVLTSTFLWLGYLNSFLNPVIYTIFNMEFRKSFKKLLLNPCK